MATEKEIKLLPEFASDEMHEVSVFTEVVIDVPEPDPLLVFLVPGIRTDSLWAHHFRSATKSWSQRTLEVRTISGYTRLSSFDLLLRFRLKSFRSAIKEQVVDVCEKFPSHKVSFVCHSMGSSLFAEVIEDVSSISDQSNPGHILGQRFENIVFLGSTCLRRRSREISGCCISFVNDVGTKDVFPWLATIARPLSYDDVGRFGFRNGYAIDRFFPNNHTSCTQEHHLIHSVLPFLSGDYLVEPVPPKGSIHLTRYTYARRAIWMLTILAIFYYVVL
jgi:hypothetical protein